MKLLSMTLATAAVICAPLMSAQADDSTDRAPNYKIFGRCDFEAPDQDQHDDCRADFIIKVRPERTPAPALTTMNEEQNDEQADAMNGERLLVRCGDRTVFDGDHRLKRVSADTYKLWAVGTDLAIFFKRPDSLPGTVPAILKKRGTELDGSCRFWRETNGEAPEMLE